MGTRIVPTHWLTVVMNEITQGRCLAGPGALFEVISFVVVLLLVQLVLLSLSDITGQKWGPSQDPAQAVFLEIRQLSDDKL